MNLREFNDEYIILKNHLDVIKTSTKNNIEILRNEREDLVILNGDLIYAQRKNDKTKCENIKNQISLKKESIKNGKRIIEEQQKKINALQRSLDSRIKSIQKDPELSAKMDKALAVRYERKINKAFMDKEQAEATKTSMQNVKAILSKNPHIENNVKLFLEKQLLEEKLNKQLERITEHNGEVVTYTDPDKANEIKTKLQSINSDKEKIRSNMYSICRKKKINISEIDDIIDAIVESKSIVVGSKGIDLNSTFNKMNSSLNRKISRNNKIISEYNVAFSNISAYNKANDEAKEQKEKSDNENDIIHWWNFIRRYKNWKSSREAKKQTRELPEPVSYTTKEAKNERKQFNDSFKYDIVREAMDQRAKADLADARNIIRESKEEEQER